MEWLVNKPYVNEVILRGQNLSFKCCQPFELLTYIERGIRSFYIFNVWSVGQRAAKLPSFKLWEWFDPVWDKMGPNGLSWAETKRQTFFDLQLWQLVVLLRAYLLTVPFILILSVSQKPSILWFLNKLNLDYIKKKSNLRNWWQKWN